MAVRASPRTSELTVTVGTGALALVGPETGFQGFAATFANGDSCRFVIEAIDAYGRITGAWEIAEGVWNAGVLTRDTLIASSTGAALNLAAGTKRVFVISYPVVPGIDVQAYSALLAALVAAGSAANKLPYYTASNAAAVADFTAFARTLLDDTDAATMRATLGITQSIIVAASDESTALTAGNAKVTFRMPHAFTLLAVRASLGTAQVAGSIFTVDINEDGATILSTKLTINNTQKTSVTATTPAVISDANLADDAEITIDIDQVGNGTAKGLKIALIGRRP